MCVFMIVQHAVHQTCSSVPLQTAVSMHCTSVMGMITAEMDLMNKAAVSHIFVISYAFLGPVVPSTG